MRVEDGLEFLAEFQSLLVKRHRRGLMLGPGMVLLALIGTTRVVGVWGMYWSRETTCPGMVQPLKGIRPVILLMMRSSVILETAGKTVLMWHTRLEHVRRVSVIFELAHRVQASTILLVSCRGYLGATPAGLAGVIFLWMHWGMSGSSEGTLLLGPEPVGITEAMWNIGVLALIRTKARIQVLLRDIGIVMIGHWVQLEPLFLRLVSCYRAQYMIWTVSRIIPVQWFIFTNLTGMWRNVLVFYVFHVRFLRIGTGVTNRPRIRLKMFGW